VIFGKRDTASIDTAALGNAGFEIQSSANGEETDIAGGGDFNGDGLGDLVVGLGRDPRGRPNAGMAAVIFGRRDMADVNLAAPLGNRGFLIKGGHGGDRGERFLVDDEPSLRGDAGDLIGGEVAVVGDANRDGLADVAIGGAGVNGAGTDSGGIYVPYGRRQKATIDLRSRLGRRGYLVTGEFAEQNLGHYLGGGCCIGELAGAGDVNGDGRADIITLTEDLSDALNGHSSRAYVVFSPRRPGRVSLAHVGRAAVRFRGGSARRSAEGYPPYFAVGSGGNPSGRSRASIMIGANLRKASGAFVFDCLPATRARARCTPAKGG
jgi:hypothetical protein